MAKRSLQVELSESAPAYRRALKRLAVFFDTPPRPGSREGVEFEVLMLVVEKYEGLHLQVSPPDPIAAIRFALEQRGMRAADLHGVPGSRQRTHDVLHKERRLTLPQNRSLNEKPPGVAAGDGKDFIPAFRRGAVPAWTSSRLCLATTRFQERPGGCTGRCFENHAATSLLPPRRAIDHLAQIAFRVRQQLLADPVHLVNDWIAPHFTPP